MVSTLSPLSSINLVLNSGLILSIAKIDPRPPTRPIPKPTIGSICEHNVATDSAPATPAPV